MLVNLHTLEKRLLACVWDSVIVLCFLLRYFLSILVLQSFDVEERAGCSA